MAEYDFNELVNELVNNRKLFAEYAFGKNKSLDETPREVFLLACENIANVYLPYGFKYSKSGQRLRLKQKDKEFIYQISFYSSHYNIPGVSVSVEVMANVLSHEYKKWKLENENKFTSANIHLNEYICGGGIGNFQKPYKLLKWNIGKKETREKEMENIIENINKLAIPLFHCFDDIDQLKNELEGGRMDCYFNNGALPLFLKYIKGK